MSSAVSLIGELFANPINIVLFAICAYFLFKIIQRRRAEGRLSAPSPGLEPMPQQDFTLAQLRKYQGQKTEDNPEGRILIAVNGKVFDVTRGVRFYGPEGPYGVLAGRDASRALAQFSLSEDKLPNTDDDLSDLTPGEVETMTEWEIQFTERYTHVGRLLKEGEEPTDYETIDAASELDKGATDKDDDTKKQE